MIHYIYALPLRQVCALMVIILFLWSFGQLRSGWELRAWQKTNAVLTALSLAAIVFSTVLHRTSIDRPIILIPFYSFVLARRQPEYYREMLMNVLLFLPRGLTLSAALPERMPIRRRIGLTVLVGLVMSLAVELTQLLFRLGTAEVDDLLTNTSGALLGALHLPLGRVLRRLKR